MDKVRVGFVNYAGQIREEQFQIPEQDTYEGSIVQLINTLLTRQEQLFKQFDNNDDRVAYFHFVE